MTVDETGVDETGVDETVVDETGVDELGMNCVGYWVHQKSLRRLSPQRSHSKTPLLHQFDGE